MNKIKSRMLSIILITIILLTEIVYPLSHVFADENSTSNPEAIETINENMDKSLDKEEQSKPDISSIDKQNLEKLDNNSEDKNIIENSDIKNIQDDNSKIVEKTEENLPKSKDEKNTESEKSNKIDNKKPEIIKDELVDKKLEELKKQEEAKKLVYQQLIADIYTDGTYKDRVYSDTLIKVSGNLPGYTKVKAYPVEIEIEGKEVIAAYDITIFDENNREYIVGPENNLNVEIRNKKIAQLEEVEVYHKEDEYALEEKIEVEKKSGDSVTFKAESFSIYAITDPKAQATRTYEFYVRNADGSLKLINTQTIRSGQSLQKPVIPILADKGRYAGWFPIGSEMKENGANEIHFFTPINFDTKTPVTIKAEPLFLDNAYIDFKERVYITEKNKDKFTIPPGYTLAPDGFYKDANGNKLYRDEVFKTRVQDFGVPIGEAHIPIIKDEEPHNPDEAAPILSYWSINPNGGPIFDFVNTPITRDLIKKQEAISGEQQVVRLDLFAIYEYGYTVSFDSQGGSHVTRQIVKKGDTLDLNKLIDPIKPGYKFKGWSLTKDGPVLTDLKTRVITHTKTLYAIYEELPGTYTVSHYTENINDGNYTFYKSEKKTSPVGSRTPDGEYFRNSNNSSVAAELLSQGYTKPTEVIPSDQGKLVKGDGTTDIKLYHKRPRYKLTVFTTGAGQLIATKRFTEELKAGQDTTPIWQRAEKLINGRYEVRDGSLSGDTLSSPSAMPARDWNLYFVPTAGNNDWFVKFIEVDANNQPVKDENGNPKVFKIETHNAIIPSAEKYTGGADIPGFTFRYVTEPGKTVDSPKRYNQGEPFEVRTYYQRLSYKLIFKTNNILYTDKIQTVPYYTPIKSYVPTTLTPGTVDKNGATFKGWYDNPDFNGNPVDFTNIKMPAKDTTYHGKWEQEKYTVRIYKEMTTPGVITSPDRMTEFQVDRNTKLSSTDSRLVSIKPEKIKNETNVKLTWYRFSGTQFEPYDFNEPITANLFLYPVWSYLDPTTNTYRPLEDIHTITYTDGKNSFTDKNLYLNNAAAIIQPPYVLLDLSPLDDPSKLKDKYHGNFVAPDGKHFQGWLLNTPNYTQATRIYRPGEVINVTSNMTFYAKWGEMDKTKITLYEQKPGTDKSLSKTETIRENGTITLPSPTDRYYNFQGWSKSPNGAVDFDANQEVMVTSENLIENKLYGIWKANRTITIHENQPVGTKNTYTRKDVGDGAFTFPEPNTSDGYTFMGWSTNPNDSTISYKPSQTINVSESSPLPSDIYGVWEKERLKLTATFNPQDVQKDKIKYTITITKPKAIENNNTLLAKSFNTSFAAEMIDSGTTTVELENGESTTFPNIEPGSTITITQDTLPKVKTSYSINGGNHIEGNTATVTAGTENINVIFYNEVIPESVRLHSNYTNIKYDDLRDKDGNQITPGVDEKTLVNIIADGGGLSERNSKVKGFINEITPKGFFLEGWSESPNGPIIYARYSSTSFSKIGDKDLYAVYSKPVKLVVDIQVDDGESIDLPIKVEYSFEDESRSYESNLSSGGSLEIIAPTNTYIDSLDFETPEYYKSAIISYEDEETQDYFISRKTIKLTRDTPPVPTGVIDDIIPMALAVMISASIIAVIIYNKKRRGGYNEL